MVLECDLVNFRFSTGEARERRCRNMISVRSALPWGLAQQLDLCIGTEGTFQGVTRQWIPWCHDDREAVKIGVLAEKDQIPH